MTPSRPGPGPVDRRLFGFAAGVWSASLVGLRVAPATAWAAATLAALAVIAVVGGRRLRRTGRHHPAGEPQPGGRHRRPWWASRRNPARRPRHLRRVGAWAVAGVLLGAVCGFTATAARTTARDDPRLRAILQERPPARVTLVIDGDPRALNESGTLLIPARMTELAVGETGSATGASARTGAAGSALDPVTAETVRLDVRVVVFARDPAWQALLPSQVVTAAGRLEPSERGDLTAALFSASGPPSLVDGPEWTQLAAGGLRAGLREAVAPLPPQPASLVPALSIGDTSGLDPVLEEEFRATGLTHLMAVSGANITIVVGFVLLVARWARAGPRLGGVVAAAALVGFVILVRPSPSVVRAAAMGAVGLLALLVGRSRVATSALASAVIASLLFDPALAVSPGFLLSVLATGALVLLAPRWRDRLREARVPPGLAEALAVPAAAQVVCAPVIAGLSGEVSLVALPANLLAAPAVAPVTVLGVAAAAVSPVAPELAGVLAWLASWPTRWLVGLAHVGAALPAGTIDWARGWPGAIGLAALVGGGWLAARHPTSRRVVVVVVLAVIAGTLPVRWFAGGWPPPDAVVVACDVGQGDAVVLPDGDGSAVVVDAGPDPVAADACLRRLGVVTIDAVVLSHFHADHIDGLAGLLRGRAVGGVVVPTFDEPASGEAAVRATAVAAGVPVVEVGPGWTWRDGDVSLTVVGPVRPLTGTRSDPNNNSLVLVAHVRGTSVLLPGDAEVEQQRALLRDLGPDALRVDVLKVPHHGSPYQDAELLSATQARVALVSVGAENPYGHPNLALLRSLADAGMHVLRTDRQGDVAVVARRDGLGVVTSRSDGPSVVAMSGAHGRMAG